jgi:transposase InsO family protein
VIEAEKANYPISMMCRALGLARSSYYAWTTRAAISATAARRAELTELVVAVFVDKRRTYGCRRIAWVLNAEMGVPVSVGTVADIMRTQGLRAVQPRAYRRTTVPDKDAETAPDRIERDFTAQTPGTRLVGDITYLRTDQGWLYLATVIDLCTRMVVGWSMADHMRTSLVVDALDMARIHGHLRVDAVFHSDRGSQYTSGEFARYCRRIHVMRSVGRTGICYDNAAAESFFATLKNEMYYRHTFPTRARARFAVAEYIEVFYNRKRHHSTLGYRTPAQTLAQYHQTATAA